MAGFRIMTVGAIALALALPAAAQTPASAVNLAAGASKPSTAQNRSPALEMARWLCAGGLELDVRPLSYDAQAPAQEWVVVYRRNGVAYSAERVDRKTAEALPVARCTRASAIG